MAVVVSTKPTQTNNALTTPPRIMTSAKWPISPASIQAIRRHPTPAMMKGSGVGLRSSVLLPRASCQTLPKMVYQPQPTRNAAMAAMMTAR
jgi:hypothetical protein